jgi:hypothetical protein
LGPASARRASVLRGCWYGTAWKYMGVLKKGEGKGKGREREKGGT